VTVSFVLLRSSDQSCEMIWRCAFLAASLGGVTAFLAIVFAAGTAQAAPPPTDSSPLNYRPDLSGLVQWQDYPEDALRKGEQGTAAVRLDVTVAGKVSACTIVSSSGSASLDATTCAVLQERARLKPALDSVGHAVPGSVTTSVTWRIQEPGSNPALDAATRLWLQCLIEQAVPRARKPTSTEFLIDRAFTRCRREEEAVLARSAEVLHSGPSTSAEARQGLRRALIERIDAIRSSAK
jgi:TonB family protein